jgi:glutathione S-transferase
MLPLILHHYDPSPFSEKVRLVLGLKGLTWRSVIVPMVLPKPDLMPLTGGNRRTPVLQIGADIFCDTSLIAEELERRFPEPTIYPHDTRGLCRLLALWADNVLFLPSSRYAIRDATAFPHSFHEDRAAMRGHAPVDTARLGAEAPHHLAQLHLQLSFVEQMLLDGRPFLLGGAASLADFAAYARVWWAQLSQGDQGELEPLPSVAAWVQRVADIGSGRRTEMAAAEALNIAQRTQPEPHAPSTAEPSMQPGQWVSVANEGFGPDPVIGEVVAVTLDRIAIRRNDPRVGEVVVHLPRLGYEVRPVAAPRHDRV